MLKHKQDDLNAEELKHCKAEFIRISRKFCDIFYKLWASNAWIKRYNINKPRERSINRSPVRNNLHSETSRRFNPVYEQSTQDPRDRLQRDKSPSQIDYSILSPRDNASISNAVNRMNSYASPGMFGFSKSFVENHNKLGKKIEPSKQSEPKPQPPAQPQRQNLFKANDIPIQVERKREYSTPSLRLGNNLANMARPNVIGALQGSPTRWNDDFRAKAEQVERVHTEGAEGRKSIGLVCVQLPFTCLAL
jgi:hypothetical protein